MSYSKPFTRAWLPSGGAVYVCIYVCVCVWEQRWERQWGKTGMQTRQRKKLSSTTTIPSSSSSLSLSSLRSTVLGRNPWWKRLSNSAFHLKRPLEEQCRNWLEIEFSVHVQPCLCVTHQRWLKSVEGQASARVWLRVSQIYDSPRSKVQTETIKCNSVVPASAIM